MKKYRLGNQSTEYELREDYLGWLPQDYREWEHMFLDFIKNVKVTIVNPENGDQRDIFLHHFIIKDAFPIEFFGEERSQNWGVFAIVSDGETSEPFIIPVY